jgi:hypothetical protein
MATFGSVANAGNNLYLSIKQPQELSWGCFIVKRSLLIMILGIVARSLPFPSFPGKIA